MDTPRRSIPVVAIACTLDAGAVGNRIEEWTAVLTHVNGRTPIPNGVRLTFHPGVDVAEVARLSAAEHACCAFFGFALTVDGRGIALEVTAPDDGQAVLAALFGAPD